ncbi:unnamed protein product [Cercospora beticola]|nr:unnamed protein product [Cercospora beticola]
MSPSRQRALRRGSDNLDIHVRTRFLLPVHPISQPLTRKSQSIAARSTLPCTKLLHLALFTPPFACPSPPSPLISAVPPTPSSETVVVQRCHPIIPTTNSISVNQIEPLRLSFACTTTIVAVVSLEDCPIMSTFFRPEW